MLFFYIFIPKYGENKRGQRCGVVFSPKEIILCTLAPRCAGNQFLIRFNEAMVSGLSEATQKALCRIYYHPWIHTASEGALTVLMVQSCITTNDKVSTFFIPSWTKMVNLDAGKGRCKSHLAF